MSARFAVQLIWLAGVIHTAIVLANVPLPRRLQVRRHLAGVPRFLRQIFYVHWLYIVLVLAFFAALCFGFARELAGGSPMGRFLCAFIAGFWALRAGLQWFFYDAEVRRQERLLDALYSLALVVLVAIFGFAAIRPGL